MDKLILSELTNGLNTVWMLLAAMLVFFMQPGFALVEAGFTRVKNTANILMKNFVDFMFRLAQALLIRARILLTVLPDTNKGVRGKNNEIKRSFTISSGVILGSRSAMLTMTLASSTALVHSAICAR